MQGFQTDKRQRKRITKVIHSDYETGMHFGFTIARSYDWMTHKNFEALLYIARLMQSAFRFPEREQKDFRMARTQAHKEGWFLYRRYSENHQLSTWEIRVFISDKDTNFFDVKMFI